MENQRRYEIIMQMEGRNVELTAGEVKLMPYTFRQCFILGNLLEKSGLRAMLKDFVEQPEKFPDYITVAADKSIEWLESLPENDKKLLARNVKEMNETFFEICLGENVMDFSEYFEIGTDLIHSGVGKLREVCDEYTLDQIKLYYEIAIEKQKKDLIALDSVLRGAFNESLRNAELDGGKI